MLGALAVLTVSASAGSAEPESPRADQCVDIASDTDRLLCYDRALARKAPAPPAPVAETATKNSAGVFRREADRAEHPMVASLLDSRWELDEASKQAR